jgi:hypothetical protein
VAHVVWHEKLGACDAARSDCGGRLASDRTEVVSQSGSNVWSGAGRPGARSIRPMVDWSLGHFHQSWAAWLKWAGLLNI